MGRKVWSGLLIGMALGIFISGSLWSLLLQDGASRETGEVVQDPGEGIVGEEEPSEGESGEKEEREAVVAFEISEDASIEEFLYDLMVEGVITSKQQKQEIYEVLTYQGLDAGVREIPLYASTEEILEAIGNR
ncbi:hypothetical protein [Isachenkonia alkalipeptolytica]|uniref:Uncharacterized protein n=1 Tax=Isachenkonia alkalipeptolytica TaxID=2565777 RepID=A0AA44BD60_9CLOT|nr:hypothetical protein [Isachenkonia alkalipeptolytica]NBG87597.1 hypothetical protein [Isachenkonia alkalipeptolytica]